MIEKALSEFAASSSLQLDLEEGNLTVGVQSSFSVGIDQSG